VHGEAAALQDAVDEEALTHGTPPSG
jgi:hypothetical protein